MEKNHICRKCGGIAGWDSYFQSWICTRCGNEEPKPITNADRIRSMSDEELAHFMEMEAGRFVSFYPTPAKTWLDWLKMEATT